MFKVRERSLNILARTSFGISASKVDSPVALFGRSGGVSGTLGAPGGVQDMVISRSSCNYIQYIYYIIYNIKSKKSILTDSYRSKVDIVAGDEMVVDTILCSEWEGPRDDIMKVAENTGVDAIFFQ